jgi:UDP-N-acetylglucosamine--N-acetylmuramyl-(pentapeptide) pyrophosphoryl-undecaprenol N-acetylglucosamine transferase
MKIGIAVSGTGGHIYPGISIAELCLDKKHEVIFFCNKGNLSSKILENSNQKYKIIKLDIEGWKNRTILNLIKFIFKFIFTFFKVFYFILKYKIDVLVGMGGYLSFPVIIAGKILGKKTVIQEQNFYPGIANRKLNIIADKTAVGFEESRKYFCNKNKVFFTGNPVRKEFYNKIDKETACNFLNIPKEKKIIFIFGGSQGSQFLNNLSSPNIEFMNNIKTKNDIFVIHITGEKNYEQVKENYEKMKIPALVQRYIDNIYYAYFASDLMICRAGASSITEIMVTEKLSILIPYPYATDDHQLKNSVFLKNLGIAKIRQEKNFLNEKEDFINDINYFLSEKNIETFKSKFDIIKNYKKSHFSFAENLYELIIH